MLPPVRSQSVTYAAGPFSVNLSCLEAYRRSKRSGRFSVHRIDVWADARFDTGGGVTLAQRDLPAIVKQVEIKDAAGYRRNLKGGQAWLLGQSELGARMPSLGAALAAATNDQDRDIFVPFVFAAPNNYRPEDCAIPVDDLLDGEITLHMPGNGDLDWAGGTGSIDSITNYKVIFHLREYFDVQFNSRDVAGWTPQRAADSIELNGQASLLRSLFLWKKAAGGGTSVTGLTDATFEALGISSMPREVFKEAYLMDHEVQRDFANQDLVFNDLAMPLIYPQKRAKMRDYPRIDGQLLGRLTTSLAAFDQVYHFITPKSLEMMAAAAARNGVPANAPVTIKTEGKTRRNPGEWGPARAYMPEKAQTAR